MGFEVEAKQKKQLAISVYAAFIWVAVQTHSPVLFRDWNMNSIWCILSSSLFRRGDHERPSHPLILAHAPCRQPWPISIRGPNWPIIQRHTLPSNEQSAWPESDCWPPLERHWHGAPVFMSFCELSTLTLRQDSGFAQPLVVHANTPCVALLAIPSETVPREISPSRLASNSFAQTLTLSRPPMNARWCW